MRNNISIGSIKPKRKERTVAYQQFEESDQKERVERQPGNK